MAKIAEQHGLESYMDQLMSAKWKYIQRPDFDSDGANFDAVFMGCKDTFIENILDAAYFLQSAGLLREKIKVSTVINGIVASLRYKMSARKRICRMSDFGPGNE